MSHFSDRIIQWYDIHKRDLPWRHTDNPYYIWVSEIMLQQTQAITVIPYYKRFIETLPTIFDLAEVEEDRLMKLWEGLGYYSRVRNMQKTAIEVVTKYQGIFPNTYKDLIQLKGIGAYTAGAILSIAFKQKFSAIDGNVMRVLSRYFGVETDITLDSTKRRLESLNQTLLEDKRPDMYTQAIIELGATLCTKHKPQCEVCPVNLNCVAKAKGLQSSIPLKAKAKAKKELHFQTFILQDEDNRFVVWKVTDNLLKGLYLLPQVESDSLNYALDVLDSMGYTIVFTEPISQFKHVFTHLVWTMDVHYGKIKNEHKHETVTSFEDIPMATAHKQIIIKEKTYAKY